MNYPPGMSQSDWDYVNGEHLADDDSISTIPEYEDAVQDAIEEAVFEAAEEHPDFTIWYKMQCADYFSQGYDVAEAARHIQEEIISEEYTRG